MRSRAYCHPIAHLDHRLGLTGNVMVHASGGVLSAHEAPPKVASRRLRCLTDQCGLSRSSPVADFRFLLNARVSADPTKPMLVIV
jgi:hypothetical protein